MKVDTESWKGRIVASRFLIALVISGVFLLAIGVAAPYTEIQVAVGATFIIAGAVAIYMMFTTSDVAQKIYERFDKLDDTLKSHTEILKEMASSMNRNHGEMMGVLERIEKKL